MQKMIISALVGGLILFIWQFLSFGMADLHYSQMQHTDKQDELLQALADAGIDEGQYFVPRIPKGGSQADQEALVAERAGQPWAQIYYHDSLDMSMGMNMIRGFLLDVIAVLLLTWLLMKMGELDMKNAIYCSVAIGLIGYLTTHYLNSVWFHTNSIPDLIDAIVQWTLVGAWLGWYLRR